jgi:hypothetical protein
MRKRLRITVARRLDSAGCLALALAGFMMVALGCGPAAPPPPKTYPAQGELTDKGGKPLAGGMIELVSDDQIPKSARSEIGSDGSFALFVIDSAGKKHKGAEEGDYRATYIPPMTAQQTESPVGLPGKIKIQSGDNHLQLKLP